ncbi:WD40 repeat domain-containing serine/threonine protein kinase [Pseudonocardia acaciae]|uniref:WD40 repeat domain-containing serine/threonine protein kinase n=1 Tax=Pseudonocardia acaciae TaxID=551276 RepID=UPI000686E00D|nr:protein kinase [Pseudonocardia acaciae]
MGPFRLLGRLGDGGMGQVFLGRDEPGRWVAVKVIHDAHLGVAEFRRRFAREIRIAGQVRAPWTVALVAADADARRPWLATEYVPGPSLHRAVAKAGSLAEAAAGVLASRLADAMAALHSTGLVHRDLKPSNVMLAPDGPRLLDFGIARALDATRITRTGLAVGTPAFMSPEQARGADGGPASDVFSLAAVLVFAATGCGPFGQATNPVAMLMRVSEDAPDLAGVPDRLRAELAPCLAKEPAERPTARQLADTLAHWAEPPSGAPGAWPPPVVSELTQPPTWPRRPTLPVPHAGARTPLPARSWPAAFGMPAGLTPSNTALRTPSGLFRRGRRPGRALLALLALPVVALLALAAVFLVPWPGAGGPAAAAHQPAPAVPLRPVQLGAPIAIGNGGSAYRPAISPDGGRLFVNGKDGIAVVDVRARTAVRTIRPATGLVGGQLFCSPDGRWLYLVEFDQIEVIDLTVRRPTASIPLPRGLHSHADLSRDGRRLVLLHKQGDDTTETIIVVDTETRSVRTVPTRGLTFGGGVVLTADGRRAYAHQLLGPMVQVDLDTGRSVQNPFLPQVENAALSGDGRELYAVSFGGLITALDAATGDLIRRVTMPSSCCQFVAAPGGQVLTTVETRLQVVDPGTGKVLATAETGRSVNELVVSPDGRRVYLNDVNTMVEIAMSER